MTGIDIGIELWFLLNTPAITSKARVFQHNRPANSQLTDVVISIPEYSYGQLNTGYVDINLFTPNKKVVILGKDDMTFPDIATLKPLLDALIPLLSSTTNYKLFVRIAGIPIRDKDGNWYVNVRVGFEGLNEALARNVRLYSLDSVGDGYGGSDVTHNLQWSGKAIQKNIASGTQLNIIAGRYAFNLRCDWVVPIEVGVQKNWQLVSDDGVYVINGIKPDGVYDELSTVRRDLFDPKPATA